MLLLKLERIRHTTTYHDNKSWGRARTMSKTDLAPLFLASASTMTDTLSRASGISNLTGVKRFGIFRPPEVAQICLQLAFPGEARGGPRRPDAARQRGGPMHADWRALTAAHASPRDSATSHASNVSTSQSPQLLNLSFLQHLHVLISKLLNFSPAHPHNFRASD